MDTVDRKIISLLHVDARQSITALAAALPLSVSATSDRLRRLSDSGVIDGFSVRVNPQAVGREIDAIIDVRLAPGQENGAIDRALQKLPIVIEAIHLTGRFDLQLRIAASNVAELNDLLVELCDDLGVEETNTRLVLNVVDGFPRPVPA